MNCCLCATQDTKYIQCIFCNRIFCLTCIEIEKKNNLHLLTKDNLCIFCNIGGKIFIRDYSK